MAFDLGQFFGQVIETIPGIIDAAGNLKKPGVSGSQQPTVIYQQLPQTTPPKTDTNNTLMYVALAFMFLMLMGLAIFLFTRKRA